MKGRRLIAGFAMTVGLLMLLMWGFFYFTDQIPELESKPIEIGLHIVAETATAFILIVGGRMLWNRHDKGKGVCLFGLGMLAYTLIVSPGYYVAQGVMIAGWAFFAILVLDLIFAMLLWKA